VRLAGTIN